MHEACNKNKLLVMSYLDVSCLGFVIFLKKTQIVFGKTKKNAEFCTLIFENNAKSQKYIQQCHEFVRSQGNGLWWGTMFLTQKREQKGRLARTSSKNGSSLKKKTDG